MPLDRLERPLRNLRVSVTDRCNLRCSYCMPELEYVWLPREDILHFEEIERLIDAFVIEGVDKVRLTGGEPLLRRGLPDLVARLSARKELHDLALTTNGVLLESQAATLRDAGLHRITVSLDTLHRDRFERLTRADELTRVRAGLDAATAAFGSVKIDSVIIRGVNDDELIDLIEFARGLKAEIRFIEYMDVGGATRWSMDRVVTKQQMLTVLEQHYGAVIPLRESSTAPAQRYQLGDGLVFGIIASTTEPFCHDCDRSRLTADGLWYLCLYATEGVDLRKVVREGWPRDRVAELLRATWLERTDRGAEQRLAEGVRTPLIALDSLRRDPHLEMHTRGG